MGYAGNSPTANFASVVKDLFSGDGSTVAFTLSKASTTNGVAVFVENVRQEPTIAYAVSGTTLTFTAAPVTSSGNNIYVLHHNAPASTATHPSAQALTATSGTFTGDVTVDTDTLKVDVSEDTVCINTTATNFDAGADDLIVGAGSGDSGITIYTGSSAGDKGSIFFADAEVGSDAEKKGQISYEQNNEIMSFFTNAVQRMVIDLNGRIFTGAASSHTNTAGGGISIKPTSNSRQLFLEQDNGSDGAEGWLFHANSSGGPLTLARRTGSSNTDHFQIASDGTLTATDTSIGSISDERLKKDIVDFTYSIDDFKKYKPRKFNWKTPELHQNETDVIGFIAQELETVDTRFVYDTDYYDVKDTDEYKALEAKVTDKTATKDEEATFNEMKLESEQNKNNLDKQYLDADAVAKASKLLKKDAMYVSVIQQLITKIETLEAKVKTLEDA